MLVEGWPCMPTRHRYQLLSHVLVNMIHYLHGVQESVSLEVFYRHGYLNVLISHHNDSSRVLVNHTEVASGDE